MARGKVSGSAQPTLILLLSRRCRRRGLAGQNSELNLLNFDNAANREHDIRECHEN